MKEWLITDLQTNDKPWVIVFFHQPPHTKGSHDSDTFWEVYMKAMRENFMPILEQYGVDLVITGHSHVYERSFLINGHYGDIGSFNPATMVVDNSSGRFDLGEPYTKYTDGANPNHGTVYVVAGNAASKDSDANLDHPAMFYGYGCDTCVGSFIIDINDMRLDGKFLSAWGDIVDHFTIIKTEETMTAITNDNQILSDVSIYPNPFDKFTNIEFNLQKNAFVKIEVFDLAGKTLHTITQEKLKAGNHKFKLKTADAGLTLGTYLIKISNGNEAVFEKIVKLQ
jgi:hypothetical protein